MTLTNLGIKHWLIPGMFVALSLSTKAQSAISPQKMMELNQDLEAMKKLMGDTLVKAEGNAMSLIYYWVSQQEKKVDSLRAETVTINTEIEKLSRQAPVDTTAISRVYFILDSMRRVEKSFAPPAN